MKKIGFLFLLICFLIMAPVAKAEYPVSFLQRVVALLKQIAANEQKKTYYDKSNKSMEGLIKDAIGLDGTMSLHKNKIMKGAELDKARQFLVFESEMTREFIQTQASKSKMNFDDFIKFVEDNFFVKEEAGDANAYSTKLYNIELNRQKFFDEIVREAYVYSLINRGYSVSQTQGEEGLIEQIKQKSDKDDTLRKMLYTNNLALQGLIFETMQMIMFEQISFELEALQMLMGERKNLLDYNYKKTGTNEQENRNK